MDVEIDEIVYSARCARAVVRFHDEEGRCFRHDLSPAEAEGLLAALLQRVREDREASASLLAPEGSA